VINSSVCTGEYVPQLTLVLEPLPPLSEADAVSREALLRTLEELSGRRIRTLADAEACAEDLRVRMRDDPAPRRWQHAKTMTLVALAAFAFLQYYLIDVFLQIASLPQVTVFAQGAAKVL
jgi:hypothetical protein